MYIQNMWNFRIGLGVKSSDKQYWTIWQMFIRFLPTFPLLCFNAISIFPHIDPLQGSCVYHFSWLPKFGFWFLLLCPPFQAPASPMSHVSPDSPLLVFKYPLFPYPLPLLWEDVWHFSLLYFLCLILFSSLSHCSPPRGSKLTLFSHTSNWLHFLWLPTT
jgi:hypothetical protein